MFTLIVSGSSNSHISHSDLGHGLSLRVPNPGDKQLRVRSDVEKDQELNSLSALSSSNQLVHIIAASMLLSSMYIGNLQPSENILRSSLDQASAAQLLKRRKLSSVTNTRADFGDSPENSNIVIDKATQDLEIYKHNIAVVDLLAAERRNAMIEPECVDTANAAVADAIYFSQTVKLPKKPYASLSEDGMLSLEWRNESLGILIIFAGDGLASLSFQGPASVYGHNTIDIEIPGALPKEFYDIASEIVAE